MSDLVRVMEMGDHLHCIAEQFDYTYENLETFYKAILNACRDTGKNLVFIDFTAIYEDTPASLKALSGFLAVDQLQQFHRGVGITPRIAVFGVAETAI